MQFNGTCPFTADWGQERFISEEHAQWSNQTPAYQCHYDSPHWLYELMKYAGTTKAQLQEERQR